ncbi:unnamed protein product [Pieris macdunnoughi]|uniref:Uncharacterized protein n=1 Tax=Pieris macdunnoughi TaxID=345717 RepID=A0A821XVM6_9NEOP|nr:unnamed protein product [Pieris macdunnoughi]
MERTREVHEIEEEKRKELVDQHRRTRPEYNESDMVMVALHPLRYASKGIRAKFAPLRDGPYMIIKQHGPSSYAVADPSNPVLCLGIYHASALTPYTGLSEELPTPVQPLRKRGRPRKGSCLRSWEAQEALDLTSVGHLGNK